MKPIYLNLAGALALTFGIAACVSAPPAPTPAPSPAPAPAPSPTPTPSPTSTQAIQHAFDNWLDAPRTSGDWTYRNDNSGGTLASFGETNREARFAIRCIPATRQVTLLRAGTASGNVLLRVRTETMDRALNGQQANDLLPVIAVNVSANDPLLDAMAVTKGRFAIETEGMTTLYIPSWTEVSRVVEDCR